MSEEIEFDQEQDAALEETRVKDFSQAVLFTSDWTVETILSQISRGNIQLNPNFQRREAWSNSRKSKFIESVIIGLPVPQLVLAEMPDQRGKYLVLDGKQRLLSLVRFTESAENRDLGYSLSGLEIRQDLSRKKYYHFNNDPSLARDRDQFLNYTLRTVIIRNWPNADFLHQVFLRLNTGSVTLSAQELRQAMAPGDFTTFADDHSAQSSQIHSLLGRDSADPRMRDVELLVRHIAFRRHMEDYKGRLKGFLDDVCHAENRSWDREGGEVAHVAAEFDKAIDALTEIFGDKLARKPGSRSFNRAIFDALAYYAANEDIRREMTQNAPSVLDAYDSVLKDSKFLEAVESDTAGLPNTASRLTIWGEALSAAINTALEIPRLDSDKRSIVRP